MISKFLNQKIIWHLVYTFCCWSPYSPVFLLPIAIQFKSHIILFLQPIPEQLFQFQVFRMGRRQGLFFHSLIPLQWRWIYWSYVFSGVLFSLPFLGLPPLILWVEREYKDTLGFFLKTRHTPVVEWPRCGSHFIRPSVLLIRTPETVFWRDGDQCYEIIKLLLLLIFLENSFFIPEESWKLWELGRAFVSFFFS